MANYTGGTLEYRYVLGGDSTRCVDRDPALDLTFDGALSYDYRIVTDWTEDGQATLYGDTTASPLQYGSQIDADLISSIVISGTALEYGSKIYGDLIRTTGIVAGSTTIPRVKWSKIGEFNFTKDKTNVAGDMPLDHDGIVYQVMELGASVVAYSSGGIVLLKPAKYGGYGKELVSDIGLLSPWAIVGNTKVHFFVNLNYELCRLTEKGLDLLGYQEFMDNLTDGVGPVLSLDKFNEMIYLCDGTTGYMYSVLDECLSEGPPQITGAEVFGSAVAFVGSDDIVMPDFNLVTDIIDFNTRKFKTIENVEVALHSDQTWASVASSGAIQVRLHFRQWMYDQAFATTPWFPIGPDGKAEVRAFGHEFLVELKCTEDDAVFDIDGVKIRGLIHEYNPTDI